MRFASAIGLLASAALAASACNIENHEGLSSHDEGLCGSYCARLSACGASQADDIEACIDACEDRFEYAHDYQRDLCECSEWSSCEDLEQGRCSSENPEPVPVPVGGSTSVGGGTSSGSAGSSTGGSTSPGPCGEGGAPSSGGQGGAGGASGGGGQGGQGGQAPNLPPPTPCVRDCDCALTEWCVDGYCSTEPD